MKFINKLQLWDLKRDLKRYEEKVKLLKLMIKHFKKEYVNKK